MPEEPQGIGRNDCIVTDNVVTSARNLVDGEPLNPLNFSDLCSFIEIAVLHERVVMTLPTVTQSALSPLLDNGIITSTMFTTATPNDPADKRYVADIYEQCLRSVEDAAVFGRGIINLADDPEESLKRALTRIEIGELLLSVEHGRREVDPDAEESVAELRALYQVFKDYADSVFSAAQHFHVHAYAGSSEIPYSIDYSIKSVPRMLYDELRKLHKDRVDKILIQSGYKTYDIPPFALIVLSRCRSRDDIVPELLRAREEFADFRETCTKYSVDLHDGATAGTNGDLIAIHNDFDAGIKLLTEKVNASAKDSRLIYRIWDVVKAATPWGISKNVLDQLKEHEIGRRHLRSVNGLMDIWEKLKAGSPYEAILRSDLFPKEFSPEDFAAFETYLANVRRYQPVGLTDGPAPARP